MPPSLNLADATREKALFVMSRCPRPRRAPPSPRTRSCCLRSWLIDIPEDNWDPIIAVNLKGVYLCCAAAGRIMVAQRRGSIINISSRAGAAGAARPYSAAKAGVNRLTAGLARELGPYNVRVNAIAPAYTRTEVGAMQRPSEVAAYDAPETVARYPLGRIAEPIDIACAALFLASDAANGITGQVLNVDCGASA